MPLHRMVGKITLAVPIVMLFLSLNAQAASLVWDASSGTVEGYKIYYGTTPNSPSKSVTVGKVTSYDLNKLPLTESVTYYFSLSAYNSAGESAKCAPVAYTPGDTTPPAPPTGVTAN